MMTRDNLLHAICDDGIAEVRISYLKPEQYQKREGAIAGFEACRGLTDAELLQLLAETEQDVKTAMASNAHDYWWHRYKNLQVEWTLNVLSAAMLNQGMSPLVSPSVRGLNKAADILGVKDPVG